MSLLHSIGRRLPAPLQDVARSLRDKASHHQNVQSYTVDYREATLQGDAFMLPELSRHRPAVQQVANGHVHEPLTHAIVPALMAASPGSMVHAGTYFGDMLPAFSRVVSTKLFAFEPLLENFVLARLTLQANNLDNVLLFNSGLSDTIGGAMIETHGPKGRHLGGASRISGKGEPITLMTIDALGQDDVSVIQLDVEGHELQALQGATETVARSRPAILIEDNERACAPLLKSWDYVLRGETPALFVWLPRARQELFGDALKTIGKFAFPENSRTA